MQGVGQHRMRRRRVQPRINVLVEHRHHGLDAGQPLADRRQDLRLAVPAVVDIGLDERARLRDRRAVRRPQGRKAARLDAVETGEVVAHVAVGRADHRRRPAHDVVAGEEGVLLMQRIADVVAGMARRGDRLDGPALALEGPAIADADIGHEAAVVAGFHLDVAVSPEGALYRAAVGHSPGQSLQRPGQRRMVQVVVGDEDVGDPLTFGGLQDRLQVIVQVRTRIDDGDRVTAADDVGAGAQEGERPRIVGHHAADQRGEPVAGPVVEGDVPHERNHARPPASSRQIRLRNASASKRVAASLAARGRAIGGPMSVLFTSTM